LAALPTLVATAAKVRNPPFMSKSAWRSNLTTSLSHHCRERPFAAVHVHLRMLLCGPPLRALVHLAAFCWLKRRCADKFSVGQSCGHVRY
jgi:hypothetical protein